MLLQILDEGKLTGSFGFTVDFRPELIDRSEVIYFNFLDREAFSQICNLELIKLPAKFKEINIRITDKVREYVMDRSFNVNSGARNIKHVVEKEIQQPLVKVIFKRNLILDTNTKFCINIYAENECSSAGVLKDE